MNVYPDGMKEVSPDNNPLGFAGTDERKQWFLDRVGKTIYRNSGRCDRKEIYEKGIYLHNEERAIDYFNIEFLHPAEFGYLVFFDTKEEVAEFDKMVEDGKFKKSE